MKTIHETISAYNPENPHKDTGATKGPIPKPTYRSDHNDSHRACMGVVDDSNANAQTPCKYELVVNQIFQNLQSIFTGWKASFTNQHSFNLAKRQWTTALKESGVHTSEQIQIGLRKARQQGSNFFPSCGQFIQWCKPNPADYGIPDCHTAYREACHHTAGESWSHPIVFHATRVTGAYEIRSRTQSEIYPSFERAYGDVFQRFLNGEQLEVPKTLPSQATKKPTDCSKAVGNQFLAKMRNSMRGGT